MVQGSTWAGRSQNFSLSVAGASSADEIRKFNLPAARLLRRSPRSGAEVLHKERAPFISAEHFAVACGDRDFAVVVNAVQGHCDFTTIEEHYGCANIIR